MANMPRFSADDSAPSFLSFPRCSRRVCSSARDRRRRDPGWLHLHHFDWEVGQAQIAWLFATRGRHGDEDRRFLAEYGFSLGLERIEARVFVGNGASSACSSGLASRAKGFSARCRDVMGGGQDMTVFSSFLANEDARRLPDGGPGDTGASRKPRRGRRRCRRLGFPFSDPLADGPVIRARPSGTAEGMRTEACLECLAHTRARSRCPLSR